MGRRERHKGGACRTGAHAELDGLGFARGAGSVAGGRRGWGRWGGRGGGGAVDWPIWPRGLQGKIGRASCRERV